MSLDVYLTLPEPTPSEAGSGIFVRHDGQTVEITREEWDAAFPNLAPVVVAGRDDESGEVFSANITHNLTEMAREAGLYYYLWRPSEKEVFAAHQLVEPLRAGLALLEAEPQRFEQFNPANGWGSYGTLVEFVRGYLAACERWPSASVTVWR